MGRVRLIASLVGIAALVALAAPQVALAGTYGWMLPGDPGTFTGSNPEHKYGAPSWSYELDGAAFPSADFAGGAWSDGAGDTIAGSGGAITMTATPGHSVAIAWTNPTAQSATVTSSFTARGLLCFPPSAPATVGPGQTVTFTVGGGLLTPCSASGTITITVSVPPPAVTLTSPANGASIVGAQPTFSGSASSGFGIADQVKVHVYRGSSTAGTPVETVTATVSGGTYSVSPNPDLSSGTYTAQAEQDDLAGDTGLSPPVTFTVTVHPPTVTLDSLGGAPLHTSTPTFTGTASTAAGDASTVYIGLFSGTDTSSSPLTILTAPVRSDGHFAIAPSAPLADGQYTAVAAQQGGGGAGYARLTFSIKVHPPALTLTDPAAGATVARDSVVFDGQAGDVFGDSPIVTVILYRGARGSGPLLGRVRVRAHGARWSTGWPGPLRPGLYSVRAVQSDDAGHTTRTRPHTFLVVPSPQAVGAILTMSGSGAVALSLTCTAPAGQTCSGTVLVVTVRAFRTAPGGPLGPLVVLFADVQLPGGTVEIVRGRAPAAVSDVLRRMRRVAVTVTVRLSKSGGGTVDESVRRTLTIR